MKTPAAGRERELSNAEAWARANNLKLLNLANVDRQLGHSFKTPKVPCDCL